MHRYWIRPCRPWQDAAYFTHPRSPGIVALCKCQQSQLPGFLLFFLNLSYGKEVRETVILRTMDTSGKLERCSSPGVSGLNES